VIILLVFSDRPRDGAVASGIVNSHIIGKARV
jgi:hypothetical protein